jgi:arsenate reductase-like glutaredoxin family protein
MTSVQQKINFRGENLHAKIKRKSKTLKAIMKTHKLKDVERCPMLLKRPIKVNLKKFKKNGQKWEEIFAFFYISERFTFKPL